MKSQSGKLSLDFMGGLTKFGTKNGEVRKFQVKTFGNDNDSEIDGIARAFAKWASEGNVPELANFSEKVPSGSVPWKITIPMGDFGIFLDIDFGHNIYNDEEGMMLKAKLVELSFSVSKGERVALFTFVKNGEDADDCFCRSFLNKKEENDKGKMVPLPFKILMDECESFTIGNAPVENEGGEDEEGGPEPVVYP